MKKLISPVIIALAFTACHLFSSSDDVPHSVVYKVTGTASSVSLTYTNSAQRTEQIPSVRVPWSYSFETGIRYAFLSVMAKINDDSGSPTVTAEIDVDGKLFKAVTCSGASAIANAYGAVNTIY
jgi:hypothetical protein